MDGTTRIATGAITTDITTAGTTICTGVGLLACMVAPPFLGIIAIGKQSYSTVAKLPLGMSPALVLMRLDHVASVVNADHSAACWTASRVCVMRVH